MQQKAKTFGEDLKLLKKYTDVIVLSDDAGKARVAVVPRYQGRVMTSTAGGEAGFSFGWINNELITSGKLQPQINAYGGEDRFWLGPEGGQFSLYFKKGDSFELSNWKVPAVLDTEPYGVVSKARDTISLSKTTKLTNYSGIVFDIKMDRTIRLLGAEAIKKALGVQVTGTVESIVFESENTITNIGKEPWKKATGLVGIWVLGMFAPSPDTTVVIPLIPGPEDKLGPKVKAYFGIKIPPERLVVKENALFFAGDGQYRCKIGITPQRAKPVLGSYDAANRVLTIVQYNKPQGVTDYVNSLLEIQKKPFVGDVLNSYNDGPASPGAKPFGPFYELETSSPAVELAPSKGLSHIHRTFHFQGPEKDVDKIAKATLGVSLKEIKSTL